MPPLKSNQFDTHSNIKSILSRHKDRANFEPDTKNKKFSTATQKTSQFRSLHWDQSQLRSPALKLILFGLPILRPSQLHRCTKIKSSSIPHKDQVNLDAYTKTKWSSARIHIPSQSRPPTRNIKAIDPHTRNKSLSARTQAPSKFPSPRSKPS